MTEYAAWQALALHDLEHSDLSYEEIGAKYGRSRDTVIKLKNRFDVVRRVPQSRMGPKKTVDMKPLSPQHRTLGIRLTLHRGDRSYTDVARELNVSRHVVKMMEIGAHDFTLTQLLKLSEQLGRTINELITSMQVTSVPLRQKGYDS